MKTTIVITKRGQGYIASISSVRGLVAQGARCGLTAEVAASWAANMMLRYAMPEANPEGGEIMAPPEIIDLMPAHLVNIAPKFAK